MKTVFFHQNMNKILFYKFFMEHYKIVIVYHEKIIKWNFTHILMENTVFTNISGLCIFFILSYFFFFFFFFGGGGGDCRVDESPRLSPVAKTWLWVWPGLVDDGILNLLHFGRRG